MSGIEFVKQTGTGLELFCDCGATTVLVTSEPPYDVLADSGAEDLETISVPATGGEVAFTCPGCSTAHWLTFSRREDQP